MHLTNLVGRLGPRSGKPVTEKLVRRLRSARLMDAMAGAILSALAAVIASAVSQGHSWKNLVPLVFILVLLVVAWLFGARAGIFGSVLAALIFAAFLFAPSGSIGVANENARSNLGWMLLVGIAFSFLFAPSTSGLRRH